MKKYLITMTSGKQHRAESYYDLSDLFGEVFTKDAFLLDDNTLIIPAYIESIKEEKEIKE